MDVDDRQPNGPEDPAAGPQRPPPGPQAPPPAGEAPTQPLAGEGGGEPKRLLRSRDDRVIGGVCAGLGRYFGVDPILFRIGAIALIFVGGAGLLVYLAGLLLIPSEDAPADGRGRGFGVAVVVVLLLVGWPLLLGGGLLVAGVLIPLAVLVGAGVLVWWLASGQGPSGDASEIARRAALGIGVLILCGVLALTGAWVAAVGGDALVAGLVVVAGLGVLAGAFARPVRWLILPALVLGLSAGAVQAAGISLDGGVGKREYRPASASDVRDRYELGMGELLVDLRDTTLPPGDTPLEIDVGLGEARVLVPEDVCVATRAEVGMGQVRLFDRDNGGVDLDLQDLAVAPADTARLVVDAQVGMGALQVRHGDRRASLSDAGFGDERYDFEDTEPGNRACSGNGGP